MTEEEKKLFVDKLLSMAKNEIRISYKLSDRPIEGAVSKIGGKPFVPKDFEWPYYTGVDYLDENLKRRPLSFLAQFNLKDIAPFDSDNVLPKSGMLSVFYELETMRWGFDPDDSGCAKIFYFSEINEFGEADYPEDLDEDFIVTEFFVEASSHISIPQFCDYMEDDKPDWDDYDECCIAAGYDPDEWGTYSKFLGYADVIQNPMQEECECVTRGYRRGCPEDIKKIPDAEKLDIKERANDWVLLFQMGTVETDHYELMFGDCGHIYFWIKKDDLAAKNFEKVWLILQCS